MNTKRNILPMLLAALLLFCLPIASLAENVPIQNVSILNTPIKGQILLEKTGQMQTTGEQGYLGGGEHCRARRHTVVFMRRAGRHDDHQRRRR